MKLKGIALAIWAAAQLVSGSIELSTAKSQEITGIQTPPELVSIVGNAWILFLNGEITSDGPAKLEEFLSTNGVPVESEIILNSTGGSLQGGIELGRVIRKYRLRTDVGIQKSTRVPPEVGPGVCFGSCSLAFVGGRFRFLGDGSRLSIQPFSSHGRHEEEVFGSGTATAKVIPYLNEMGINVDFLTLSPDAGSNTNYEPQMQVLERLNVVTGGFGKTTWAIESAPQGSYLKGERDTVYGFNKFMLGCVGGDVLLFVIFDPKNHGEEILNKFNANSLVIDGKPQPITPRDRRLLNGVVEGLPTKLLSAVYQLPPEQVEALRLAKTVGVVFQSVYNSPFFFGFWAMPTEGGPENIAGFLKSCDSQAKR
jgi:hypothetical protein